MDLAAGNDTDVEQKWLDKYGEQLTPDEASLLRRITQQPRRAETLLRWSARTQSNQLGDDKDGTSVAVGQPLLQLADAYHATITNLLERISTSGAKDPRTDDTA